MPLYSPGRYAKYESQLGSLVDNGGKTMAHALTKESLVVDAGNNIKYLLSQL